MQTFSYASTPRIHFGFGEVARIAEHIAPFLAKRVLVVTDKGVVGAGLLSPLIAALEAIECVVTVFDDVLPDPSEELVLSACHMARDNDIQLVIGYGGGSPMDVAKLVAILAHPDCIQSISGLYGIDNVHSPRFPLVLLPTTSGTGSEVTPISIVTTGEHTKAGVVSPQLQADVAILDPQLTIGLPPVVTASTGIDAMVHAIEAYTSKSKKNPYSDMLAITALQKMGKSLLAAVNNGNDKAARADMMLGACLAGQAFANSPVAAVHALAYPLGGRFHLSHGLSNALVLPHVMRFNLPICAEQYAELAPHVMGEDCPFSPDPMVRAEGLIDWLVTLHAKTPLPQNLSDCDISEDDLDMLAADAMEQQRLLVNNPREVTEQDARAIYQAAL